MHLRLVRQRWLTHSQSMAIRFMLAIAQFVTHRTLIQTFFTLKSNVSLIKSTPRLSIPNPSQALNQGIEGSQSQGNRTLSLWLSKLISRIGHPGCAPPMSSRRALDFLRDLIPCPSKLATHHITWNPPLEPSLFCHSNLISPVLVQILSI